MASKVQRRHGFTMTTDAVRSLFYPHSVAIVKAPFVYGRRQRVFVAVARQHQYPLTKYHTHRHVLYYTVMTLWH